MELQRWIGVARAAPAPEVGPCASAPSAAPGAPQAFFLTLDPIAEEAGAASEEITAELPLLQPVGNASATRTSTPSSRPTPTPTSTPTSTSIASASASADTTATSRASVARCEAFTARLATERREATLLPAPAIPPRAVDHTPARPPHPAAPPRASRRALAWVAGAAAALVAAGAGGEAVVRARRVAESLETATADAIHVADERVRAGWISTPAGDSALDHLLTARALQPGDARAATRLEALADTLESQGRRAVARGNLEDASVHLAGALRADPDREGVRAELERVEARMRAEEVGRRAGREPARGVRVGVR